MASPPAAHGYLSGHLNKKVGSYYLGRTIGEGTYAKVKYGQHAETGEGVAIKVLSKEELVRSDMVEQIKREITILKQIRHPQIVNLLEVMSSRDKIFMVLELVTGGELFDKIVAQGPMKEPAARRVFCQLLDAVAYCHSQGAFHRDIKPENVLLTSTGAVKLSDFGLGALARADSHGGAALLRTTCGTPNYVAPEVLAKKGYRGGPADIWSLGVVLYVVLAGCLPFDEDDLAALFRKIAAAQYEVPPWLSADAVALLRAMMNPDPDARPTPEQLWQHPWVRGGMARRSAVSVADSVAPTPDDLLEENVQPEELLSASSSSSRLSAQLSGGSVRRANAFELIKAGLDISALFEARDDHVARHTRFTSRAPLATIAASIDAAAVAVGGRVQARSEGRLRLHIPAAKSGALHVLVELFELLPGTHVVEVQKVRGDTAEFYKWYADLTQALASIVSKKQPGPAGDVGARAAAARRRAEAEAGSGRRRANAFELIATSFNVGALFEEAQAASRHVQFSSRRSQPEILDVLEAAAADLGGSAQRKGAKRTTLTVPVGTSRSVRLQAHLFEVLAGVSVCQIAPAGGSGLDFMRVYGQLAGRLQPIMMKRAAFPTAAHAGQLLRVTADMSAAERAAVEEAQRLHASSSAATELSERGSGGVGTTAAEPGSTPEEAPGAGGADAAEQQQQQQRRQPQPQQQRQQQEQRSPHGSGQDGGG